MDLHNYLIDERKRKLTLNELMASGRLTVRETHNGVVEDKTTDTIEANKRDITEIEEILAAANIKYED